MTFTLKKNLIQAIQLLFQNQQDLTYTKSLFLRIYKVKKTTEIKEKKYE